MGPDTGPQSSHVRWRLPLTLSGRAVSAICRVLTPRYHGSPGGAQCQQVQVQWATPASRMKVEMEGQCLMAPSGL